MFTRRLGKWLLGRKAEALGPSPADGAMSSAGCGGLGEESRSNSVCENQCQRHCCAMGPALLLLWTGIGAGNADNFVYLLLTRQHVTLHSDTVSGAPTFSFASGTV